MVKNAGHEVTRFRGHEVDGSSAAQPRGLVTSQPTVSEELMTKRSPRAQGGFTLIEMMVVVTIIGILAATAMVAVRNYQRKAAETALRDDLTQMRKALDNFYADKQRFPTDLNELVPNYLRRIPVDPITKQVDWEGVQDQPNPDETADTSSDAAQQAPGIVDVKCKAPGKTLDNVPYSDL